MSTEDVYRPIDWDGLVDAVESMRRMIATGQYQQPKLESFVQESLFSAPQHSYRPIMPGVSVVAELEHGHWILKLNHKVNIGSDEDIKKGQTE